MNDQFLSNYLKKEKHQSKTSFDSIYSSEYLENFSLSSSSFQDSDDSENVESIVKKNQQIKEIVTNRLTVFLYMSQKWYEDDEVKEFRKSVDKTISFCSGTDEQGGIFVKSVLEQITQLQREYERLEGKLHEAKDEILNTETEEEELKEQMNIVEHNVNRFIIETREKNNTTCQCLLM